MAVELSSGQVCSSCEQGSISADADPVTTDPVTSDPINPDPVNPGPVNPGHADTVPAREME